MPDPDIQVSPALSAALDKHRQFLLADDIERSDAMEAADCETLAELLADVDPLFAEINQVLDQLVAAPHPLPDDLADLEMDLNSLGQAGGEAHYELERRC